MTYQYPHLTDSHSYWKTSLSTFGADLTCFIHRARLIHRHAVVFPGVIHMSMDISPGMLSTHLFARWFPVWSKTFRTLVHSIDSLGVSQSITILIQVILRSRACCIYLIFPPFNPPTWNWLSWSALASWTGRDIRVASLAVGSKLACSAGLMWHLLLVGACWCLLVV